MSANKRSRFRKPLRTNEEISSLSSSSSSPSSSDSETDARDLKSIKEYLSDRKELASQLFKSVKADKIKMMLPLVLKQKLNMKELEELCENELTGMSKSRILSIINGKKLVESSNTEDSDSSGPSLEIISDTEEWLSSDSSKNKNDPANSKSSKNPKKSKSKSNHRNSKKPKLRVKNEPNKEKRAKVKIEGEKKAPIEPKASTAKPEKDGDSLLDLLELEMRARAIRALIRKEEDVIPTTSDTQSALANALELDKKISAVKQRVISEFDPQQLEDLMKQATDEDLVILVPPTTTIEILSTDEEGNEEARKKKSPENNGEDKGTNAGSSSSVGNEGEKGKDAEGVTGGGKENRGEKSETVEEIIDLDDYPDDIEGSEDEESKDAKKGSGSETWASRYYSTDDVKSVIKESKIQSEIRKRLRERQRLRKIKSPTEEVSNDSQNSLSGTPTIGSVQEYLALKGSEVNGQSAKNDNEEKVEDSSEKPETTLGKSDDQPEKSDDQSEKSKDTVEEKVEDNSENSETTPGKFNDQPEKLNVCNADDKNKGGASVETPESGEIEEGEVEDS